MFCPTTVSPLLPRQRPRSRPRRFIHRENTVFVAKLPPDAQERDIALLFAQFGNVIGVYLERDERLNSRNYGFVEFDCPETAKEALRMNHEFYKGPDPRVRSQAIVVDKVGRRPSKQSTGGQRSKDHRRLHSRRSRSRSHSRRSRSRSSSRRSRSRSYSRSRSPAPSRTRPRRRSRYQSRSRSPSHHRSTSRRERYVSHTYSSPRSTTSRESKDALSKLQDLIMMEEIVQQPTDDYFDLLCEDWSANFDPVLFNQVLAAI